MKRLLYVLPVLLILGVFGCQESAQVQKPATPDYDAIINQLKIEQQEYADAWCNLDMEKIGQVWAHDPDITIWGPAERDRVQGWDGPNGVKAWYQASMDAMETCDFKIHDVLVKVSKDGTAAVVTYYVENDFVNKDGSSGKGTPRVTVVKELRDGVWKQIHGDASFSVATIKGM